MAGKIARKLMAHYISVDDGSTWLRLGKDLEEYNIEMNAEVETKTNILGESSTNIGSYAPQASVEPFYAEEDSALFTYLQGVIDERKTNDDLAVKVCEVHLWDEDSTAGTYKAYEEDAVVEVSSYGGDTNGYQIPFNIYYCGNRKSGKFVASTSTFTAD